MESTTGKYLPTGSRRAPEHKKKTNNQMTNTQVSGRACPETSRVEPGVQGLSGSAVKFHQSVTDLAGAGRSQVWDSGSAGLW